MSRRVCEALAIGGLLALLSAPVRAAESTEIEARRAFVSGQYERAIELFAQLYAETLHPNYLRNLGRCHQKLGHPKEAIDFFHDYLRRGRSITDDERKEVEGYIAEMQELQRQRTAAPPVAPAMKVEPERRDLGLVARPEPPPSAPLYRRWWFWTLVGAVVAGGVAAGLLVARGSTSRPPCPVDVTCGP